jgi:hypothetical protein
MFHKLAAVASPSFPFHFFSIDSKADSTTTAKEDYFPPRQLHLYRLVATASARHQGLPNHN